jgi:hypothetical protein
MMKAALVLAGAGALAVMEIATPPRATMAVNEPLVTEPPLGVIDSAATMTKAGRWERHSVPMPAQSALLISPIAPANPAPATLKHEKTIGPHLLPQSKSKHTESTKTADTARLRPAVEVKSR